MAKRKVIQNSCFKQEVKTIIRLMTITKPHLKKITIKDVELNEANASSVFRKWQIKL